MPNSNDVIITYQGGGLNRQAANQDHISCLVYNTTDTAYTTSPFAKSYYTLEDAEADGIIEGDLITGQLWYHVSEFFRLADGNGSKLWVYQQEDTIDYDKVVQLTNREVLQYGLFVSPVQDVQSINDSIELYKADAIVLFQHDDSTIIDLPNFRDGLFDFPNTGCIVSGDGAAKGGQLAIDLGLNAEPCVGSILGMLSRLRVNESFAHVAKCDLSDGFEMETIRNVASATTDLTVTEQQQLHDKGFVFLKKYTGRSGTYADDNPSLSELTNDIAYLNDARVLAKVKRGVRAALLQVLSAVVTTNPNTGQLAVGYCKHLEVLAGEPLVNMLSAGEISGYKVTVDPNQNVQINSTIQIVVQIVPTGISRTLNVTLQFVLAV
jgi:hypothetical protein